MVPLPYFFMVVYSHYMRIAGYFILWLCGMALYGCKQSTAGQVAPQHHSSEFSFLYQYAGRRSADVGMFTNHIVNRRLANLLKDKLLPFMDGAKCTDSIQVDAQAYLVAHVRDCDSLWYNKAVFVASDSLDAIWLGVMEGNRPVIYTERTSLPYPAAIDMFIARAERY